MWRIVLCSVWITQTYPMIKDILNAFACVFIPLSNQEYNTHENIVLSCSTLIL